MVMPLFLPLLPLCAFGPRSRWRRPVFATCLFGCLLLGSASAMASPVVDVAPLGAAGCYAKQDLIDLLKTNRAEDIGLAAVSGSMLKAKIASGKCFSIKPGEAALTAPEWQGMDFGGNIAAFATRSGRRFYSVPGFWHYVGNVTRFAEPPLR